MSFYDEEENILFGVYGSLSTLTWFPLKLFFIRALRWEFVRLSQDGWFLRALN